jgi:hypothetical protein
MITLSSHAHLKTRYVELTETQLDQVAGGGSQSLLHGAMQLAAELIEKMRAL